MTYKEIAKKGSYAYRRWIIKARIKAEQCYNYISKCSIGKYLIMKAYQHKTIIYSLFF